MYYLNEIYAKCVLYFLKVLLLNLPIIINNFLYNVILRILCRKFSYSCNIKDNNEGLDPDVILERCHCEHAYLIIYLRKREVGVDGVGKFLDRFLKNSIKC